MARRRRGTPIDGVLLLDKAPGVSSNRALQQVRRLYDAQKAGHTGTLDPMATGLLPVCFGEATKFSAYLLDADKTYRTWVRLGEVTDTGDAEGTVIEHHSVPALDERDIEAALAGFRGEVEQVPPMYSALKHQGRPLYELAREGKHVERAARRVTVYDMRLLSCEAEGFELEVRCSKGTYIRTLAEDIGHALGCGAHITSLRRLRSGPFEADAMHAFSALEDLDAASREARLLPVDTMLTHLPSLEVAASASRRLLHGQRAQIDTAGLAAQSTARLYRDAAFLGLVTVTECGEVAPRRLLNTASLASE
ncbi:tRNA pseudouridine(55) synthase TruB [Chromohalobacter israelensis]|uniref:tRNA pseudouridine synthase B n=1 Tax=Chromohalobacter israelensis (strain ATCC BAA-138 / DSM 3043 / CIP 106854 / NCIMB 13768 / 1H11) TaxID=290398 RepID=TRUB_CHRI1|nr:tRNA pseudouridine(55) synthase TruB [Chromohalobacter salexigens]Q1QSZ2.1 RecName: Full=tRNA pseudouridine synthase B; AltName: Full=tRNA pseudouridine(55) synthase; Short=Psi55 synthase; AltName: Full=tRNA pseudouridylate synthase; AltName: Full=tRNA-uridine isomerase [Chromohalobacter salexigens DSM 3043]ABE60416.1 tRNA pseudouridine synthase B [Chromohalobacter salexigens DSM 3043]